MFQLKYFFLRRLKSFNYAINGVKYVFKKETNFKIHLIVAFVVVILGFYFEISKMEWIVIFIAIFSVLFAEVINTVIELLCDYVSPEFNKNIGLIKDLSAAAVLILSAMAVIIGLLVFLPKILAFLRI